jgi:hypothetical protein
MSRQRPRATEAVRNPAAESDACLIFLQHDFRGFDYGGDFVADLQLHFIGAAFSDYALDEVLADANDDISHYSAELKLNNFAFKTVPS